MQDASKVLLGSVVSSAKEISIFDSDPATYKAGLAVRLKAAGLSLLKSEGQHVGISAGKSLSDSKKTAVVRTGTQVPLRVALKRALGTITVSNYSHLTDAGADTVEVAGVVFTAQTGAATPGDATFQAASSNNATAASLAAQINAHTTAKSLVVAVASGAAVTVYARAGGSSGNDIEVIYTNTANGVGITLSNITDDKLTGGSDDYDDINYLTLGAKAYINDFLGIADFSTVESTISDATIVSSVLTGVDEDGTEYPCILVDIPGGL